MTPIVRPCDNPISDARSARRAGSLLCRQGSVEPLIPLGVDVVAAPELDHDDGKQEIGRVAAAGHALMQQVFSRVRLEETALAKGARADYVKEWRPEPAREPVP